MEAQIRVLWQKHQAEIAETQFLQGLVDRDTLYLLLFLFLLTLPSISHPLLTVSVSFGQLLGDHKSRHKAVV